MSFQPNAINREIESALETLAQHSNIEMVSKIRPILYANWDRKRVQTYIEDHISTAAEYIDRVAEKFEALNPYIHKLQIERADDVWGPLVKDMQKWAYRYLVKKGYNASQTTWEIAEERAHDAAKSILTAHFPYDTEFEPWARVVVRNACLKYIRSNAAAPPVLEDNLENLEDKLNGLTGFISQDEHSMANEYDDLFAALQKLSNSRRQVIEMKYFQGLSPSEIAAKLGKSIPSVHLLQFRALEDLRKILAQNRNKLNE